MMEGWLTLTQIFIKPPFSVFMYQQAAKGHRISWNMILFGRETTFPSLHLICRSAFLESSVHDNTNIREVFKSFLVLSKINFAPNVGFGHSDDSGLRRGQSAYGRIRSPKIGSRSRQLSPTANGGCFNRPKSPQTPRSRQVRAHGCHGDRQSRPLGMFALTARTQLMYSTLMSSGSAITRTPTFIMAYACHSSRKFGQAGSKRSNLE